MRLFLFMLLAALVTCSSSVEADSWVKDPTTGCTLFLFRVDVPADFTDVLGHMVPRKAQGSDPHRFL